ncbi:hypothetical protein [Jiella sp. M17.18]|uniref:hypothetical protein n=1 Tax=Jiella sp. M17.18 TaxID=3234247 RepID=UPI0034DE3A14
MSAVRADTLLPTTERRRPARSGRGGQILLAGGAGSPPPRIETEADGSTGHRRERSDDGGSSALRAATARASQRRPTAFLLLVGLAALLYGALAVWLFAHPAALPSDDALYFARGLMRFSILDFSPQFPGYPGFIALGRLLLPLTGGDPVRSLFVLTILCALALPPLAAWTAWEIARSRGLALAAFLLALTQPLLPGLALSLLSDAAGLAFFALFLALLAAAERRPRLVLLSGLALGIAACCRPSYAALFAGALGGLALTRPRDLLPIVGGALLVGVPALLFLFAREGTLLITEGLRFTVGHTLVWGNTLLAPLAADDGWLDALGRVPFGRALAAATLIAAAAAAVSRPRREPVVAALLGAFAAHLVWVVLMQNPDHLRHLAPLPFLAAVLAPVALAPASGRSSTAARAAGAIVIAGLFALQIAVSAATLAPGVALAPPLQQAARFLRSAPSGTALATNEGVAVLRESLPAIRVYDMHYPADAAFGLAQAPGEALRLSTMPLPGSRPFRTFAARSVGEQTLYLARLHPGTAGTAAAAR